MSAEAFLNEYFRAEIGPEYEGLTVADAVKASCGFLIDKPCGGRGKCGKCAVFVLRGIQAVFPGNIPGVFPYFSLFFILSDLPYNHDNDHYEQDDNKKGRSQEDNRKQGALKEIQEQFTGPF